jgi:uncharacterized membrane protein YhaH (DUF805 family)
LLPVRAGNLIDGGQEAGPMRPMSLIHFFFAFHGRITRFEWWLGCGFLSALSVLFVRVFEPDLLAFALEEPNRKPEPPSFTMTVWNVLLCLPTAALSAKRFNDRDLPAWNAYLLGLALAFLAIANHFGYLLDTRTMGGAERVTFFIILVYSLWALYENGFRRGTKGYNRHGHDPLYRL